MATGWSERKDGMDMVLIEPLQYGSEDRVRVGNPVVKPAGVFADRVVNLTDSDIWLQPHTKLGVLHCVDSIESGVDFTRVSVNEERVEVRTDQGKQENTLKEASKETPVNLSGLGLTHAQEEEALALLRKHSEVFNSKILETDTKQEQKTIYL